MTWHQQRIVHVSESTTTDREELCGCPTNLMLPDYRCELLQLEVVDDSIGNTRTKDNPRLPNPTICSWRNGEIETIKAG